MEPQYQTCEIPLDVRENYRCNLLASLQTLVEGCDLLPSPEERR